MCPLMLLLLLLLLLLLMMMMMMMMMIMQSVSDISANVLENETNFSLLRGPFIPL
ncbi:hypothetical protein STEG23_014128, partial [Scotinomys teguina]